MKKLSDIEVKVIKGPVKEAPKFVHLTFKIDNDGAFNTHHHLMLRTNGTSVKELAFIFLDFAKELSFLALSE